VIRTLPQLHARLLTNERGDPIFVESKGRKHYRIQFEVKDAPKDAYAATFELDPKTYYDPTRTLAPDDAGNFVLSTTTYGDYPVSVQLRTKEGVVPLVSSVKEALEKSRAQMGSSPEVDTAIDYIAHN